MNETLFYHMFEEADVDLYYNKLPEKKQIKITDDNASKLWAILCTVKENALKECKEAGYEHAFAANIYMSGCMAGILEMLFKFRHTDLLDERMLVREFKENLENYRKQKLFQLTEKDKRFWTDGERIFPCMDTWNVSTQWDKLKQILAKEKKMGMRSDLLVEAEIPFDAETDNIRVYTELVRKDATIRVVRQVLLSDHMRYANEIVNTVGISREEADVLVEECDVRKKINTDLDNAYLFEAIQGLSLWIQIAREEGKTVSEIAYLAGLSLKKTGAWTENPEREMIREASCHGFGQDYIARKLHLPIERVQSYMDEICGNFDATVVFSRRNCLFEDGRMPTDCRKAIYSKYIGN